MKMTLKMKFCLQNFIYIFLGLILFSSSADAEDGYQLWLRYTPLNTEKVIELSSQVRNVFCADSASITRNLARQELSFGLRKLFSRPVPCSDSIESGSIVLVTAGETRALEYLDLPYADIGEEGFIIRAVDYYGKDLILVTANRDIGLLYGVFELLRYLQLNEDVSGIDIVSYPKIKLRLLDHWDNLNRTVERGYAGQSIWDWWRLPDFADPRYSDYARANASIGINGAVLNNVNSNPLIFTRGYLEKVAAIADVLRPWGMRVYLSARFSAPQELGGLETSDPLNAGVIAWWQERTKEIYSLIPDFGGFLVKANSEGQPGPQEYGRTHAEGANMLAAALHPYGGIVMWRAFVYSTVNPEDRAKQAWSEFKPLDGSFADNVIIQVKNGPIDFQPREPFHPLFGSLPRTPMMMEFQITKEYLGFATHLVYLGPLFEEVLKADTYSKGEGTTVAKVIDGSLQGHDLTGIAGVSGIGTDRDWLGSDFNQANWYVYGKLAWDPMQSTQAIAREWLALTFSGDPDFIDAATGIMMRSHEAAVNYMTPLGLAHLMGTGHHYGPAPWVDDLNRPEWNPVYYHRADKHGIGFDRTSGGSDALSQYTPEAAAEFSNPLTMGEKYLLWFHHLPWDYRMQSGDSLWEELINHYDMGVAGVKTMIVEWEQLKPYVDEDRFTKASKLLQIQYKEALWWRDACIAYFKSISGLPLPEGVEAPEHDLEYYKSLNFPNVP